MIISKLCKYLFPFYLDHKHEGGGDDVERQPFLGNSPSAIAVQSAGPVRLTPGWEDATPTNADDFHLRSSLGNLSEPPVDR